MLTYEGALIDATFFSCSGGRTEDALAVWGTDVPYLCSVASPGEEAAQYDRDSVTFSREALEAALDISLGEDQGSWVGAGHLHGGGRRGGNGAGRAALHRGVSAQGPGAAVHGPSP